MVNGGPEPAGGRRRSWGERQKVRSAQAYLSARDQQTSSVPSNLLPARPDAQCRSDAPIPWDAISSTLFPKGERRRRWRWNLSRVEVDVDVEVEVLSLNKAMPGGDGDGNGPLCGRFEEGGD